MGVASPIRDRGMDLDAHQSAPARSGSVPTDVPVDLGPLRGDEPGRHRIPRAVNAHQRQVARRGLPRSLAARSALSGCPVVYHRRSRLQGRLQQRERRHRCQVVLAQPEHDLSPEQRQAQPDHSFCDSVPRRLEHGPRARRVRAGQMDRQAPDSQRRGAIRLVQEQFSRRNVRGHTTRAHPQLHPSRDAERRLERRHAEDWRGVRCVWKRQDGRQSQPEQIRRHR